MIGGTQYDKNRADVRLKRRVYKALRDAGYGAYIAYLMLMGIALGGIARFNYVYELPENDGVEERYD